jgi:Peptidase A4 family
MKGESMKSLLARAGIAALLGASLVALFAPSAPQVTGASGRAPSAAVVAQARHAFIKAMSAHQLAIGKSHWVSPGVRHGTAAAKASSNGTLTSLQSANWSGYGDGETSTSTTVSQVSGNWTIPQVRCLPHPYQNQDAFLADWVGIDGLTNGTVEQLGTATQCFEDVEYYYVWYEMYPAGTVEEGTTACINDNVNCPRPGDRVSASVTVTPGSSGENNYTLTLTDHTRPQESFSTSQQCAATTCLDSSAEWIVERPAVLPPFGVQILPLADFGRSFFNSGHVVSGGVRTSIGKFAGDVDDITMTDDTASYILACNAQRARPGALLSVTDTTACPTVAPGPGGRFSTTWDSSF